MAKKFLLYLAIVVVLALGFWAYLQPEFVFIFLTQGMMC